MHVRYCHTPSHFHSCRLAALLSNWTLISHTGQLRPAACDLSLPACSQLPSAGWDTFEKEGRKKKGVGGRELEKGSQRL
eukprot:3833272-Rhodomonas_salina.1